MTRLRTLTQTALVLAASVLVAACGGKAAAGHAAVQHPPEGLFDNVRGWLAIGGWSVVAVDPDLPSARITLLESEGSPLAWSLDGTKLLVARRHGYDVLSTDGRLIHVAPPGALGGSFTWNGNSVIYGTSKGVFRVSASGGTPHRISARRLYGVAHGWQPSPDGLIPFMRERDIWVMNADGSHERRLVSDAAVQALAGPREVVEFNLGGWSRDGSAFAFTTSSGKPFQCRMFVVGTNGRGLHRVPITNGCPWGVNWSPDRQHLVAHTDPNALMIVDTQGRPIRTVPKVDLYTGVAWNTARRPERSIAA